jgi:hypothetical protein
MAVDRAGNMLTGAKTTPAIDPVPGQPSASPGFLRRGDQYLADVSRTMAPDPKANLLQDALRSQVDKRLSLASKAFAVMREPQAAVDNARQGMTHIKNDVDTLHGAAKIVTGNASLTKAEAAAIAGAVARDTATGVYGATKAVLKGSYAAATTTEEGVRELSSAVTERVGRDALQAGTGIAISNAAATAVGAFFPAARMLAVGIRVTGQLAAGAQVSEALRNVGGTSEDAGATMKAVGKTLRSKAGSEGGVC